MKVRWYNKINGKDNMPGALDNKSDNDIDSGILVSYETRTYSRKFNLFKNHVELMKTIDQFDPRMRRFHEITPYNSYQKPRFDIDVSIDDLPEGVTDLKEFGQKIFDGCLSACIKLLEESYIDLVPERDVSVFTSHGINKMSYHLIINNYMHSDSDDAKGFYEEVIERTEIPKLYSTYIDRGIYNKNHALRILGSRKLGSDRVKVYNHKYTFMGHEVVCDLVPKDNDFTNRLSILESSLITFVSGCDMLPPYKKEKKSWDSSTIIDEKSMKKIESLLDTYTTEVIGLNPFQIMEVKDGMIKVKRISSSYCEVCCRNHDKQHPYMYTKEGRLLLHCGRAKSGDVVDIGKVEVKNVLKESRLNFIARHISSVYGLEADNIDMSYMKDNYKHTKLEPKKYNKTKNPQDETVGFTSATSFDTLTSKQKNIVDKKHKRKTTKRKDKVKEEPLPIVDILDDESEDDNLIRNKEGKHFMTEMLEMAGYNSRRPPVISIDNVTRREWNTDIKTDRYGF